MSIFQQDNPFNDFMSHIGDMALANVAWSVCSLPIVTIGASTQALFEVARAIDDCDDDHVLKRFWAAFTRRFGTNLVTGIIFLAFYGLVGFDMWYTSSRSAGNGDINAVNYGICAAIGISARYAPRMCCPWPRAAICQPAVSSSVPPHWSPHTRSRRSRPSLWPRSRASSPYGCPAACSS